MVGELVRTHGIVPVDYAKPVLTSFYERSLQTAQTAGFAAIHRTDIIDESEIYTTGPLAGVDVINKHVTEDGWLPEEEIDRAYCFIEAVRKGRLPYEIVFSHGMIIAAIVSELARQGGVYRFDEKRGYVPLQAGIVRVEI